MNQQTLGRNLAVFSLGLGFAELLAPRKVARWIGVSEEHERILQALGLREIASGLGIMQGKTSYFLWSRVAGDVMDLALLAAARRSERSDQRRIAIAMAAVAGTTVLDLLASVQHSRDYAEPGWRDPRPMEARGGLGLEARGASFSEASRQPAAQFEPIPESTGSEELTEAPASSNQA